MAGGWSRDGAVQDQIDASVDEAVSRARQQLPKGESLQGILFECQQYTRLNSDLKIARFL